MLDHLRGRPPSPSYRRVQVLVIIAFWFSRVFYGSPSGPRVLRIRKLNAYLRRFSPWQLIISAFTAVYALTQWDVLFGLSAPEPLARLYSPSFYRAAWIASSLDAGFASGMPIRYKWLRDICSVVFSVYYLLYPSKSEEKLRKYRAVCTTELLRATWNKTANPYIRLLTFWDRPRVQMVKQVLLKRPDANMKPVQVWLFFAGAESELAKANELILDFPGGGFVSMGPRHHEERLRRWAIQTGKPVLAVNYSKAPEYPYPYAIRECFDVYRLLTSTEGKIIGMSGIGLDIIMSGDSAGANICANVMFQVLQQSQTGEAIRPPVALVFSYPAFDFGFSSWMSPNNLRILQAEHRKSSLQIAGLVEQKNHYAHKSPLAVVSDRDNVSKGNSSYFRRRNSSIKSHKDPKGDGEQRSHKPHHRRSVLFREKMGKVTGMQEMDEASLADTEDFNLEANKDGASASLPLEVQSLANQPRKPFQTRLSMTSRVGYFQDQIISPSMMRAMAILYVGPNQNPDFETDYRLSPILAPYDLLANFPPVLIMCGEKDPFVDDSVIFAGRLREAKRMRKEAIRRQRSTAPFHMSPMPSRSGMASSNMNSDEALMTQTEDDWVQLEIIEGWSHGYLQMTAIMPEARDAIEHLGDWIEDAFVRRRDARLGGSSGREVEAVSTSETEMEEPLTIVTKNRRMRASASSDRPNIANGEFVVDSVEGPQTNQSSPRATQSAIPKSVPPGLSPRLRPTVVESGSGSPPIISKIPRMVNVKEGDIMKRRRLDAVLGMEETPPESDQNI